MEFRQQTPEFQQELERILGYLNYSSGAADASFLTAINRIFAQLEGNCSDKTVCDDLVNLLRAKLKDLSQGSSTFHDSEQAAAVLDLFQKQVLAGYRTFHSDLLQGVPDIQLYRPLFIGRVFEAIIRQGSPWTDADRITRGAIRSLNDFIGHRPIPSLESQKIKANEHEWVRPIPWFIRGVGVGAGRYHDVVEGAIKLLESTDRSLLEESYFDPQLMDELAVDPRPYDFDHPANKRPNYHFGQWDPHHIDQQGRYRRFVVQEVTLEALWQRVQGNHELPPDEILYEASAVLAGTILMAAGVSGRGPETHDSSVTLGTLLPKIAKYRDRFYEYLIARLEGPHGDRLREEAKVKRQPFGGARQHLNAQLARRRASQLEHVHLAWVFSRMGYAGEASRHVEAVSVPSARMLCQIECRLTEGWHALEQGRVQEAAQLPGQIFAILQRAIDCGAVVDPWNILGFDGHFSLFPALENSIHDHRVDALVGLVEEVLAFYARIWSEGAARDDRDVCTQIPLEFERFANWWHKFAAHEVQSAETSDPLVEFQAAKHVAHALNLWQKGGAGAGDVGFWAPYAEMFNSPKAYALVIDALLDRRDHVASMALLVHWLGQAASVPLEHGEDSFFRLAERWIVTLLRPGVVRDPDKNSAVKGGSSEAAVPGSTAEREQIWQRIRKLFDYLEANAEEYWQVPSFQLRDADLPDDDGDDEESEDVVEQPLEDEGEDELFEAAYEDMVYRDTTDDGVEGDVVDSGDSSYDELDREARRIADRMAFLTCLARLWRIVVLSQDLQLAAETNRQSYEQRVAAMRRWISLAQEYRDGIHKLLEQVKSFRLRTSSGDHDAMIEYDRKRVTKEALLDEIIATGVEISNAARILMAAVQTDEDLLAEETKIEEDEKLAIALLSSMMRGDVNKVRNRLPKLTEAFAIRPLLYVPLARGGEPREILETRVRQRCIQDLLAWLPRFGMLSATCSLIECAREMERDNPVGPGAVTEFDELFKIGYEAIVEHMIVSAKEWRSKAKQETRLNQLVAGLEKLTESMLMSWLTHSRTLRLSVLERVYDRQAWSRLNRFIQDYGADLFTQRFLNLGNLRAILHQGVDEWLQRLAEEDHDENNFELLSAVDVSIPRQDAVDQLSLVIEAIVENYAEYRDYNSTTTQSDRGDLLYSLLDFLRLRTRYDRICWNLKPVVWAHEMLVRRGLDDAARLWRRSLKERTHSESDQFMQKLEDLQKKYAMQMPSVAERVSERFLQPLYIDRIRALIEPAIRQAKNGEELIAIDILRSEVDALTRDPRGSGLDTPAWLVALEEEVERARRPDHERTDTSDFAIAIPRRLLSLREIERQIDATAKKNESDEE